MADTKTIKVFCAREQAETDHSVDIDANGEIVLTCVTNLGTEKKPEICNRFLKYPANTDLETLKGHLEVHKEVNLGQVSIEESEKKKKELIEGLSK